MSSSKKVLLISYDYRPSLGGVATCAFNLAKTFSEDENIKLTVMAQAQEGDTVYDKEENIKTIRLPLSKTALFSIPKLTLEILKYIRKEKPDFILSLLWLPSGFSLWLATVFGMKTPYYVIAHGVEVLDSKVSLRKRVRGLLSPFRSAIFKKASKVFTVSDFTKDLILKTTQLQSENIAPIYNGVDPKLFDNHEVSESISQKYKINSGITFSTITRLDDYKGVDKAIEAFALVKEKNKDFQYLVGGIGQDKQRLEDLIEKHGLRDHVKLCGKIPSEELTSFYNLSDVNVLLSRYDGLTPNFEGFGLVYLEAGACGVPSLAGHSGGIPNAVKHNQTGLLVNPEDPSEIAKNILSLIEDKNLRERLGSEAYRWSRNDMTWAQVKNRIMENL